MEVKAGKQEGQLVKTYALTSENLKKFEEQFIRYDSLYGRRKIPQRTAGDGKSDKVSVPSLKSEIKHDITEENVDVKPGISRVRRSFYRPVRDSVRRNPEGRSQNESIGPPPLSGKAKTIIYDEEDYRIPYEDPNHVINLQSRSSHISKREIVYETSSASSSTVTQVQAKNTRRNLTSSVTSEGSIPTSTSADSDDGIIDDYDLVSDDSSDDSDDDQEEVTTKHASSFYESSISSSSVSSIPTHPSRQESSTSLSSSLMMKPSKTSPLPPISSDLKQVEMQTLAVTNPLNTTKEVMMRSSKKVSEPSPPSSRNTKLSLKSSKKLLNQNGQSLTQFDQISMKDLKDEKVLSKVESSISSFSDRDTISRGTTSRKDSLITIDSSVESYVTIRNWSRWTRYSEGGYSITNKIVPLKRHIRPRRKTKQSSESSLASSSASESSRSNSTSSSSSRASSSEFCSLPNLDDYNQNVNQSEALSRISNLEIQPRTNSSVEEGKVVYSRSLKSKVKLRKETENDVEGFDFKHRTKKIPKLRDRPKRQIKEGTAGVVFSQRPYQFSRSRRRRRRKRQGRESTSSIIRDDQSMISSTSYTASLRRKAAPSLTTATALSPVSMTTESSISRSSSVASSNDPPSRRRRENQLQPLNVDDSGFVTVGSASSVASIRPAETPFTPAWRNRYMSPQSIVSGYSSCHSICRSSSSSQLSASSLSLSTHSDGESTPIGPYLKELPPKPLTPLKQITNKITSKTKRKPKPKIKKLEKEERKITITEERNITMTEERNEEEKEETVKIFTPEEIKLPPVIPLSSFRRRKTSPYYSSLSPAITARMNALQKAIKIAKNANQRHKQNRLVHKKVFRVSHPMPSFEEVYRDHGMPRLIKLARPKESKAVWATSFWPVRWGDQTMIFPISKSAMKFKGTPRLEQLAVSKKDFRKDHPEMCARDAFQFSCGRSSVILEVSPLAMKKEASARVIELAKHKTTMEAFEDRAQRDNYIFSCGRTSPIWSVSEGAKTAEERERTMNLAQPKKNHQHYKPEKPCIWPVSAAARRASPSPRIEQLARPKTRSEGLHREPTWVVPSAALRTVASARVQELAKAKQTAEGYEHCRELDEPMPRSVLRASATDRIKSLSKPIIRETMDHVQFNPDAFKVSPAALKGRMPDRIAELAQPIARR